ncbi:MAG: hypothetical protein HFE75_14140 [Firmicutes bacterium]|jgi:hypothetical protein|nr:hypothetical protein [Bacillota bacterium]
MKKKILIYVLVLALTFSCGTIGVFASENINATSTAQEPVNDEFIDLDDNDSYELDDETAEKMDQFIEEFENQLEFHDDEINMDDVDLKYFKEKYGEDVVLSVEENINELNELAEDGDIEITPNGTVYDTNEDDMYVQGKLNINKSTTYWWGRINYLNYTNANKLKKSLSKTTDRTSIVGLVAGGVGLFKVALGPYSFAFGAVSAYTNYFYKRITACNKKNKGIKYKLYWTMNFKMRTQGQAW